MKEGGRKEGIEGGRKRKKREGKGRERERRKMEETSALKTKYSCRSSQCKSPQRA